MSKPVFVFAILVLLVSESRGQLLTNPSFEVVEPISSGGVPTILNNWDGNVSEVVQAESGIVPFDGTRMLKFMFSHGDGASGGVGVGVRQILDPFTTPGAFAGEITVTAVFNRVAGDAQTDTEFRLELEAWSGTPNASPIAVGSSALISDSDPLTWEPLTAKLILPPNTMFFGVHLLALENVFNDTSGIEIDGHYADAVTLSTVPEPATIVFCAATALAFAVAKFLRPGRTTAH